MESPRNLQGDLESMRVFYRSGESKEVSWRKSQLKGLLSFLEENEVDIMMALKQDLGKHYAEAFRDEVGTLIKSLNLALKSLKKWMSPKKAKLPAIALLSTAELVPEPLGLVLIFSSWNFPFGVSLEPLIGALAAGNTVVLKPSELAPTCSSLLANTMPTYLDGIGVKVIQGGPDVGEQLLQERWDKIFFTGSPRVARIVMSAAAKYLTPVVLELGGKCPAVFDSLSCSWDREAAVKRILVGKFGTCAGQACITIDYILVERKFLSTVVDLMKVITRKMFGENPRESNCMARIVNKQHFLRLKNLIEDPMVKSSIVYGGKTDEENLFIEPTILVDPPLESAIMTEEIFGPLLPIITLEKIEESVEFIKLRPKPLALYVFTKSKTLERRIISETCSGSVTINDAIIQVLFDISEHFIVFDYTNIN
ncbi:Aldehyde dehydrogenase NAD(P)-dependent [Trema orientale]|uniref:Aldehyde dehydrogenase n=1 Tax=Trema orientale TaxID=63057 RepID=A0A2P5EUJ2_TREOI|nr:Aldehyde dehydrogenase NAD(P)-dependent [Trema orientale]